ncbi:MAG: hypothetical protein ACRD2R_08380 [Terriglobales bacterium]
MTSHSEALGAAASDSARLFAPLSATRLYVFGGIVLIATGMLFGEIFAVFLLHPTAEGIGESLLAATRAVAAQDAETVLSRFAGIGSLLESRGTKVDTHVHIIKFGYLALLLALVQPYVALSESSKKRLAQLFLLGAVVLPPSVFLIHYVGLAHTPLQAIGWASILADFGGFLTILATAGVLAGLWRFVRGVRTEASAGEWALDRSWCARALLSGGMLLVLAGFLHGAYYAAVDLYEHERQDTALLRSMAEQAASGNLAAAEQAVAAYGALQGNKAVKIAAHAHIIEFGFLAMLLAYIQPLVFLSERWRRRWVVLLLAGSVILPVAVLAELRWGLLAGGVADAGGMLVVTALVGMLVGVLRHTGAADARAGGVA